MFFSHNKSVSVGLSAIETISRIVTKKIKKKSTCKQRRLAGMRKK
jgi:hypothetical protein